MPPDSHNEMLGKQPHLSRIEKDRLVAQNRARLDQDLLSQRLQFQSLPRGVDLQLSNICNMACTMCYDGVSPPAKRLDLDVVERFAQEVLPTTVTITPFSGSEPMIVTWDLTKELAMRFDLELDLITNAQFLDEARFRELEPHVSSLTFSIDSHMRDIYERIRLRSNPDKVFENFPRAARLCREQGIEPIANVVFMVENAAYMQETVAFLADQGCSTVRMLAFHTPVDASRDRTFSDAVRHMSPEWVRWKLDQIHTVAKQKKVRVVFEGHTREIYDYRPSILGFRKDRKFLHSASEELSLYYPGYCVLAVDRIKVSTEADVHPCCVAVGEDLKLGNLKTQSFQEVWNGPNAQDLRRGMLTMDLPYLCKHCTHHTANIAGEQPTLPVVDWYHDSHCGGTVPRVAESNRTIAIEGPAHLTRNSEAPTFRWSAPTTPVDMFHLVVGIGGMSNPQNRVFEIAGNATSFTMPDADWAALPPNTGLWWCLYGLRRNALAETVRSPAVRCIIRHQPIPRVAGSTLYDRDALHAGKHGA